VLFRSIWESGVFYMPKRLSGRFYIENRGNTAADQRLQEQGTFRFLVDVPIQSVLAPISGAVTLGSVYFKYTIKLSKPCINTPFFGGSDIYSTDINLSRTSFTPPTDAIVNLAQTMGGPYPLMADAGNNAGTAMVPVPGVGGLQTFKLEPALWNVETVVTDALWTKAAIDTDLAFNIATLASAPQQVVIPTTVGAAGVGGFAGAMVQAPLTLPWDLSATPSFGSLAGNSGGAWVEPRQIYHSATILVPEGVPLYYTPYHWFRNGGGSNFSYSRVMYRFTVLRPFSTEITLSASVAISSSELVSRLKRLEAFMLEESEEEKEEVIPRPGLTPTPVSLSSVPTSLSKR